MPWKKKALPPLITRIISYCMYIHAGLILWSFIDRNDTFLSLRETLTSYSLLLIALLCILLVTVIEKPNEVLNKFVIYCDMLILVALVTTFFIEDNFVIQFFCGFMPGFIMLIVLSYPKTAHYMQDKYYEAVRDIQQKNSIQ
jgi:hypothetical protein